MMNALTNQTTAFTTGIPLPYSPRMDDGIALLLLGCFFVSAYALSLNRKFLFQLANNFLLNRERTSIFITSTAAELRFLLLLIVQACVLGGIFLFNCFNEWKPDLTLHVAPLALLGIHIGICLLYFILKWLTYSFIGWIFFDEKDTSLWLESYSTLVYYLGFTFFPLVLLVVYFDLPCVISLISGVILLLFFKILTFYKWLRLFCNHLYGVFFLIVYFCALEIMPCLVLYRVLVQLNDYFIINF